MSADLGVAHTTARRARSTASSDAVEGCGSETNASCNCGVPYTPKIVRAAEAIKANPQKSDRAIAAEIGASHPTVAKARREVGGNDLPPDRTGHDGKSYPHTQPIESDPATCKECGCVIEDLEVLIHLRAADMVTQWELADPRDAWRHTGEQAPPVSFRNSPLADKPQNRAAGYSTPQATVDAFWYVTGLDDPEYLKRWLADHPLDVATLQRLWEAKNARP